MKIKAIPIKSQTLCEKCEYSDCDLHCAFCRASTKINGFNKCGCTLIAFGEPCRYFKRKEGAENV